MGADMTGGRSGDAEEVLSSAAILARAIAQERLIKATYNRGTVTLAPYVLYEKDEAFFVDALTIERDGLAPREEKIGAFRLTGLGALTETAQPFRPDMAIAAELTRQRERVLVAVSTA